MEKASSAQQVAVELVSAGDEWAVRVTEAGDTQVMSFEDRHHAESFSQGQAIRLGVEVRSP